MTTKREHRRYKDWNDKQGTPYRLPKQFPHWIKKAGLKPASKWDHAFCSSYIGRGHVWRINCFGMFECSEPIENFDRWANSSTGAEVPAESLISEAVFLETIQKLREEALRRYKERLAEEENMPQDDYAE